MEKMEATEDFIMAFERNQKEVMLFLHQMFMSTPGVRTKIRYKLPFYDRKNWICYLNPTKKGEVELAFTRGNELSNSSGLLASRGRKQVYSVTLSTLKQLPQEAIYEMWQEALLLDETIYIASKRRQIKQ